jgi:serine/threonine protein kinase
MAPEQLRSAKSVDARTDQWGIGVVLHELLTGRLPFSKPDFTELVIAISQEDPPPLRAVRADVPVELESVVLRCLARDPAGRFRDVVELAEALAPCAPSEAHASVEHIRHVTRTVAHWAAQPQKAPPSRRRGRGIVAAAIAVGIGAAAVGFVASRHAPRSIRAERQPAPITSSRIELGP